ncbi:MAG: hypothetical protein WBP12_04500 [Candidatus Saccharimonas sp.]
MYDTDSQVRIGGDIRAFEDPYDKLKEAQRARLFRKLGELSSLQLAQVEALIDTLKRSEQ